MRRFRLLCSHLSALALVGSLTMPAVWGGFDEGLTAYRAEDYARAWAEFEPLAEVGHAQAQFYLGFMCEKGQGREADDRRAADWYRKSADQGVAGAQFNLGLAYEKGRGVAVDPQAALTWFRKAASQGNLRAQYRTGEMYEAGTGAERDLVQAHLWFSLAAKKRYDDAKKRRRRVAKMMGPYEIAEAEMLARNWRQAQKAQ